MHTEIVKKIRRLREEKGLSPQTMAEKLHLDVSAYRKLESGKTYSWAKYLEELLGILETSAEDFFEGIGSNINNTTNNTNCPNPSTNSGYVNVENHYTDSQEKIEQLYEARLKDKDLLIEKLELILEKLK